MDYLMTVNSLPTTIDLLGEVARLLGYTANYDVFINVREPRTDISTTGDSVLLRTSRTNRNWKTLVKS